jgi:hypothetical protein
MEGRATYSSRDVKNRIVAIAKIKSPRSNVTNIRLGDRLPTVVLNMMRNTAISKYHTVTGRRTFTPATVTIAELLKVILTEGACQIARTALPL